MTRIVKLLNCYIAKLHVGLAEVAELPARQKFKHEPYTNSIETGDCLNLDGVDAFMP